MTIANDAETKASPPRRRHLEVLEAAARVFHEKGYESTSIQDIADAVGILKGSLYYYITSKEDLLFEILQDVHEQGLRNLERIRIEGDLCGRASCRIRARARPRIQFGELNRAVARCVRQHRRQAGAGRGGRRPELTAVLSSWAHGLSLGPSR